MTETPRPSAINQQQPGLDEVHQLREWINQRLTELREKSIEDARRARTEAIAFFAALSVVGGLLGWLGISQYIGMKVEQAFEVEILAKAKTAAKEIQSDAAEARRILASMAPLKRSSFAIACAIEPFCVAVDHEGNIYHYNSNGFVVSHKKKVLDLVAPYSVTCAPTKRCLIVDATGKVNVGNAEDPNVWAVAAPVR